MADFLYSLNSSTIKPTPILQKIAIAGKVGYSGIELWHDDIDQYLTEGGKLADLRKALDEHQLKVPTTIFLKGWCDTTGEEHQKALDECKRRLEQAAEVGAVHSIAGPPLTKVDYGLAGRNYRELLELGLEMGVKPATEYLGFAEQVNTIEAALKIMTESGHPQATVVLDPFHNFRGGGSIESISKLKESQVAMCHFDDASANPPAAQQHDPDRVMPGDGVINLKRFVELLRQIGYDRWISLELFRKDLWAADPMEVARIGLDKMRSVVEA